MPTPPQPHTLPSRTSQHANQNLAKSVSAEPQDQSERQISGRKEARLPNSTYPKGGVSCSKDSFVVNHPPQADFKSRFVVKVPPFG